MDDIGSWWLMLVKLGLIMVNDRLMMTCIYHSCVLDFIIFPSHFIGMMYSNACTTGNQRVKLWRYWCLVVMGFAERLRQCTCEVAVRLLHCHAARHFQPTPIPWLSWNGQPLERWNSCRSTFRHSAVDHLLCPWSFLHKSRRLEVLHGHSVAIFLEAREEQLEQRSPHRVKGATAHIKQHQTAAAVGAPSQAIRIHHTASHYRNHQTK